MPHHSREAFLREVGKDRLARPHDADVSRAIWLLHKVIARNAFVIRFVTSIWQIGDVQIRDRAPCGMLCASGP